MKKLLILLFSVLMAGEMEVDGDLKVKGNIILADSAYITLEINQLSFLPTFQQLLYIDDSQTWVVPPGTYSAHVELWGAGGAGGCGVDSLGIAGGGGSGGYARGVISFSPGDSLNITVGQGGHATCDNNGGNGTETSIINNSGVTLLSAGGGTEAVTHNSAGGNGGNYSINWEYSSGFGLNGKNGISGGSVGGTGIGGIPIQGSISGCGAGGNGNWCGAPGCGDNNESINNGGNGCLILMISN